MGNWDNTLTTEQVKYAGLDALAGLLIYKELLLKQSPREEPALTLPELQQLGETDIVILCHQMKTPVAYGRVVSAAPGHNFDSFGVASKTTKTKVCVAIKSALLPAQALWDAKLREQRVGDSVSTEDKPVYVLVPIKCIRVRDIDTSGKPGERDEHMDVCYVCQARGDLIMCDGEGCSCSAHTHCVNLDAVPEDEWFCTRCSAGTTTGTSAPTPNQHWSANKVKLDVVHAMFRIEKALHKKHGAYHAMLAALRDALMVPDADEIKTIKKLLISGGKTETEVEKMYKEHYAFFLSYVSRAVPEPGRLLEQLNNVASKCVQYRSRREAAPCVCARACFV